MNDTVPEQDPWAEIAAELHRIAYDAATLIGQPAPNHFELNIQPWSADDYRGVTPKNRAATIASVDAVALALIGKAARTDKISGGQFFHKAGGHRGRVGFSIYQSVADPAILDKDEELERLRARVAELEAGSATDPTGLAYTRADDEPAPVVQVFASGMDGPAGDVVLTRPGRRVEPHTGAMTDEGLVDETPAEPVVRHYFFDTPTAVKTACGLDVEDLPQGDGWVSVGEDATCPSCRQVATF